MKSALQVKKRRNFGDILTDPFKLIFRNLKAIFLFNLMYIFLPLTIGLGGLGYIQIQLIQSMGPNVMDSIGSMVHIVVIGIIAIICLFVSGLHIFASTYAIIKTAYEKGFENIEFQDIQHHFTKKYLRNFIFVCVVSIVSAALIGLIGLTTLISPILFVIIAIFLFLFLLLYVYPLVYIASNIYMFENKIDIAASFAKAREYLSENWGIILGTFLVSSIIYSFLSYTFAIPFTLIGFMMMDFTEIANGQTDSSLMFTLIQQTVSAFFTSFLFQYIGICMYFKYFDLEEKQFGYNLLDKIDQIGESTNSYFENEGEF